MFALCSSVRSSSSWDRRNKVVGFWVFGGHVQSRTGLSGTHHQLREHGVQLLRRGHGQGGLQCRHGVDIVVAVGDLWLVTSAEAAEEQRGQATPLGLLRSRCHGYQQGHQQMH